jgi:hypothetical protein
MAALERMYAKLRLRVNRAKSKVELAHKRSLLSYSFWYSKGGAVMCRVAPKAARALKQRVRQITSTVRTAVCGPACPVVWQGSSGAPLPPMPISADGSRVGRLP